MSDYERAKLTIVISLMEIILGQSKVLHMIP